MYTIARFSMLVQARRGSLFLDITQTLLIVSVGIFYTIAMQGLHHGTYRFYLIVLYIIFIDPVSGSIIAVF